MDDRLIVAAAAMACALLLSSAFVTFALIIARAARLAIVEASVGVGPVVVRLGALRLRALPWSSFITPARRRDFPNVAEGSSVAVALAEGRLRYVDDVPIAVVVALAILPSALAFVLALALLGAAAPGAVVHAIPSIVRGACSPLARALASLDRVLAVYRSGGLAPLVGLLAAAMAAVEVLLWPSNALFVAGAKSGRPSLAKWRLVGVVAAPLIAASWAIAVVVWIVRAG